MTTDDPAAPAAPAGDSLRPWLRLLACTSLVEREVRSRLRGRFATTLPRFDVLAPLDAAARAGTPGRTMSDLSARLMVTNGNLTGLVERLAPERLVSRGPSPTDRRAHVVRPTPAGKRALDAMTPEHQAWIDDLFGAVTADERGALHALRGRLWTSIRGALGGALAS